MARSARDELAHPGDRRAPRHGEPPLDVRLDLACPGRARTGRGCSAAGRSAVCASVIGERAKATAIAVPTCSRSVAWPGGQQRQERVVVDLRRPDPGVAARLEVAGGGGDVVDPGGQQRGVEEHGCRACPTRGPPGQGGARDRRFSAGWSAASPAWRRWTWRTGPLAAACSPTCAAEGDALDAVVAELEDTAWLGADPGRGLDGRPPDRPPRLDRRAGAARRHRPRRLRAARSPRPARDLADARRRRRGRRRRRARRSGCWRAGGTAAPRSPSALRGAARRAPGCRGSARR